MLDRGLDVPAVLNLLPEDIFAVLRLRCICASWLIGKSSTSFCQEDFPSRVGCQPEAGLKGIVHYFSMSVLKDLASDAHQDNLNSPLNRIKLRKIEKEKNIVSNWGRAQRQFAGM